MCPVHPPPTQTGTAGILGHLKCYQEEAKPCCSQGPAHNHLPLPGLKRVPPTPTYPAWHTELMPCHLLGGKPWQSLISRRAGTSVKAVSTPNTSRLIHCHSGLCRRQGSSGEKLTDAPWAWPRSFNCYQGLHVWTKSIWKGRLGKSLQTETAQT